MNIRQATSADARALLKIYAPYVTQTAITFETEIPTEEAFAQRIAETLQRYPYLIAEENGVILGYAYATAYKTRAAYDWTTEVTVYIDQEVKAKGIGTRLYQQLESELKKQNIVNLTACITAGNEGSVRFHQKFGYKEVAFFPKIGHKFNQWYDVLWMQKELQQFDGEIPSFVPYASL
ncbi:GNAT family N-acetyltransferase [Enterococcus sp.]|uniref:GNAT family N-acetyltransferase n=1 Tax=Enterococcus sp. TaxID=35783 RepID=UPI0025C131F4|nr:GNAT family N-acetyltransferase [Enterococcus sp.]